MVFISCPVFLIFGKLMVLCRQQGSKAGFQIPLSDWWLRIANEKRENLKTSEAFWRTNRNGFRSFIIDKASFQNVALIPFSDWSIQILI